MPSPAPIRVLVTGGAGLLGGALVDAAAPDPGFAVTATFHRSAPVDVLGVRWLQLDLRDAGSIARTVAEARPEVVLHCAVAIAPEDLEPVVVEGSAALASAAAAAGAWFVQVSSDMVFDGASGPFAEDAPLSPITDYGRAKARAENAVRAANPDAVIVRASLLYRLAPPDRSLASWLAGLERGDAHPLFTDELRHPAHVDDVARALLALARRLERGETVPRVLHAVGPETISRYDFGRLVLEALGQDPARAREARLEGSGLVRPRALVLTTDASPDWFREVLRGPREALSAEAARGRRTSS
jgi:dTDP-4-dehydrorhamnose reductase